MFLGTNFGQSHRDNSTDSGNIVDTGILSLIQPELNQHQLLIPSQIPTKKGDNSPITLAQRNLIKTSEIKRLIDKYMNSDAPDESTEYDFSQNDDEI